MTITNGYATLDDLKVDMPEIAAGDLQFDSKGESAIAGASRQIDGYCNRRFWQDGSAVARTFWPDDARNVTVGGIEGDISTTSGLIVKIDINDDGGFAQTLTITTNYIVTPINAALNVPIRPFETITLIDYGLSYFPRFHSGRPSVQVTAKWGWPAIPDAINKACRIQALQLFQSPVVTDALHPLAAALCDDFVWFS